MDNASFTIMPRARGAGALTTFYSYEGGPQRSEVLARMAWLLAGRQHATVPTLMIDWDLESPGLHYRFGAHDARPGLLELLEACCSRYAALAQGAAGSAVDADDLARQVLRAVDWTGYVERVDAHRPLYLLRAGRFDDSYGERAAQLDWHALYRRCPALLRQLRIALAQAFRHVFIAARCGRSAAVSVCTALLPDQIVGLFTPGPASLDGLCGAVRRAIDYRCSHEDEQRPLLVYPLPCAPVGASAEGRHTWRRDYQDRLEALMRTSYGRAQCSLAHYCDAVLLHDVPDGELDAPASPESPLTQLLDWVAEGRLPWQSHEPPAARAAGVAEATAAAAAPPATGPAQFPALRHLGEWLAAERQWRRAPVADTLHLVQLVDAVEAQLDQLQRLVDRQALCEARPLADKLRDLVLRPAVKLALRRRGAALIKLVYRHDNDTDALLAFTQDELAALERVLSEATAGRPLAFSST